MPGPRPGYLRRMDFVRTREGELGAPVTDVAQEAVDATATTYANDAGIDVEAHLRTQLESRGLRTADQAGLAALADRIRAGHASGLGRHDGSVDAAPTDATGPTGRTGSTGSTAIDA